MAHLTTGERRRGYILQEIAVGLVIFAIAVLPVLRAFRMLPQIGSALGQQSRLEAWRSANDEAVLQGLDPTQTPLMQGAMSGKVTGPMMGTVIRKDIVMRAGQPQITSLSSEFYNTAEERAIPAGFEIGAGTIPLPPRVDPLPPLAPIQVSAPLLNPSSGTLVLVLSLAPPAIPGEPFTLLLRAQGRASSDMVRLQTRAPEVRGNDGIGSASISVNAVELAQSVRGQAWSEYAGIIGQDIPVALPNGRTRWLVHDGSRLQVYEPSEAVDFILGLDLGRPLYSIGGVEYASGQVVPIDYSRAVSIGDGRTEAILTYPAEVRARFGSEWSAFAPSFSWSFGSYPGDSSSGNTRSFFGVERRAVWSASQTLAAAPQGAAGLRQLGGTWTIERQSAVLQPPERLGVFYDGSTDAPGWLDFTAPIVALLQSRIGRPEINGVESIGGSVSVPVVP